MSVLLLNIRYVIKRAAGSARDSIAYLCGVNRDGTIWKLSAAEIIAGINSDKWEFYITVDGDPVRVDVAKADDGRECLTTLSPRDVDALFDLPECPPG